MRISLVPLFVASCPNAYKYICFGIDSVTQYYLGSNMCGPCMHLEFYLDTWSRCKLNSEIGTVPNHACMLAYTISGVFHQILKHPSPAPTTSPSSMHSTRSHSCCVRAPDPSSSMLQHTTPSHLTPQVSAACHKRSKIGAIMKRKLARDPLHAPIPWLNFD